MSDNIIAQFMGGRILKEEYYASPHGSNQEVLINEWLVPEGTPSYNKRSACIGMFSYKTDWNCLIPVIERIENIKIDDEAFRFAFHKNVCVIESQYIFLQPSNIWHVHLEITGKNKIDATYNAILEFIRWMENEKKNKNLSLSEMKLGK